MTGVQCWTSAVSDSSDLRSGVDIPLMSFTHLLQPCLCFSAHSSNWGDLLVPQVRTCMVQHRVVMVLGPSLCNSLQFTINAQVGVGDGLLQLAAFKFAYLFGTFMPKALMSNLFSRESRGI